MQNKGRLTRALFRILALALAGALVGCATTGPTCSPAPSEPLVGAVAMPCARDVLLEMSM
jgi:hypothetical protein